MWMEPAFHMWAAGQVQQPGGPCRRERVLSRVRHPSFSPDQVDDLLRGMSRRQLRLLWVESAELLHGQLDTTALANIVAFRSELLERLDPDLAAGWLQEPSGR